MAHNIQIPVSFDFRIIKATWSEVVGRIVGYGRHEDDVGVLVKVEGRTRHISFPKSNLPDGLWERCDKAFYRSGDPFGGNFEYLIEETCSRFRPNLLVPSSELSHFFWDSEAMAHSLPADGWQLREAFLRVTPDTKSVLAFLNRWGSWGSEDYVLARDFLDFQNVVRQALVSPPDEWFEGNQDALDSIDRQSEYPYFVVQTFECETAIRMTITMDLLRQQKFKLCKRPDCNQPFAPLSAHKRMYCTQYCSHLESLRRSRQGKKKRG